MLHTAANDSNLIKTFILSADVAITIRILLAVTCTACEHSVSKLIHIWHIRTVGKCHIRCFFRPFWFAFVEFPFTFWPALCLNSSNKRAPHLGAIIVLFVFLASVSSSLLILFVNISVRICFVSCTLICLLAGIPVRIFIMDLQLHSKVLITQIKVDSSDQTVCSIPCWILV